MNIQEVFWNRGDARTATLAMLDGATLRGAQRLQGQGYLVNTIFEIFQESRALSANSLEDVLGSALKERNPLAAIRSAREDYVAPRTASNVLSDSWLLDDVRNALARLRVTGVGAGPGTLIPMGAMVDQAETSRGKILIDPKGKIGGQWVNAQGKPNPDIDFFNNPSIRVGLADINGELYGRSLDNMMTFFRDLTGTLRKKVRKGSVEYLVAEADGRMAVLSDGTKIGPHNKPAELTIVAPGNQPLPLESGKMETNAGDFAHIIERKQRRLTKEEARNLDGKTVVVVGLGNSALAQERFIQEANDSYGVNIKMVILTHFTSSGIFDPHKIHLRADGTYDSVARDLRNGLTTNLELDIPSSARQYFDLCLRSTFLNRGFTLPNYASHIEGIIPSVKKWVIDQKEPGSYKINATVSKEYEYIRNGEVEIDNVGMIFALIGYGVPAETLNKMGFLTDSQGKPLISYHDGAAIDADGNADSSLTLAGFGASHPIKAPSVGTMPGMAAQAPIRLFEAILRAASK